MIKKFPWHTLFITLYSVLFLFAENIEMVKASDIIHPLLFIVPAVLILYVLSRFLFKRAVPAAIFTSTIVFLFFSYGHYYELLYPEKIPLIGIRLDQNFYKWFSLCLLLLIFWRFRIKKKDATKLNSLLNFITILLLCMPLYKIGMFYFNSSDPIHAKEQIIENKEPRKDQTKPNIYYIIVDAYGRQDVLQDLYGFDNSSFITFLKDQGFYVADQSFANYCQTILSLPSSLNMMYLDSFAQEVGIESKNRWPLKDLIDDNKTVNNLKEYGYTSVAFDAAMFTAVYMDSADVFIETPGTYINLFENELINNSVIRAFHREMIISDQDAFGHHRKKILNAFKNIKKISKKKGPFYVHGHILAPHQPFVFNSKGEAVDPNHEYTIWIPIEDGRNPENYKQQYIEQLQFVNTKLREVVTDILENSEEEPVIIIQGDHGPCSELLNTKGYENNNFGERMPILNAYYFPDKNYKSLYDSISPVNSFRVIFNQYFGAEYPLLKDESFFSDWDRPYEFYNVTDSITDLSALN